MELSFRIANYCFPTAYVIEVDTCRNDLKIAATPHCTRATAGVRLAQVEWCEKKWSLRK
jgi:hypothetical protein